MHFYLSELIRPNFIYDEMAIMIVAQMCHLQVCIVMKGKLWRTNAISKCNNPHCDVYLGYFGCKHFEDTCIINDNIPRVVECGFFKVPVVKSELVELVTLHVKAIQSPVDSPTVSPSVQSPVKPKASSIKSPPASPLASPHVQSPPASPPVQSPPASPLVQSPPASPPVQSPPASPAASPVRRQPEIWKCSVTLKNIVGLIDKIKRESVNKRKSNKKVEKGEKKEK